jgi:hypothetical protein
MPTRPLDHTAIIEVRCEGMAMDKQPKTPSMQNTPWWTAIGLRRSDPAPDTDYADMGTAFGLDASMKQPERDAAQTSAGDTGPSTDRLNRRSVL